jgi:hypothetical protein
MKSFANGIGLWITNAYNENFDEQGWKDHVGTAKKKLDFDIIGKVVVLVEKKGEEHGYTKDVLDDPLEMTNSLLPHWCHWCFDCSRLKYSLLANLKRSIMSNWMTYYDGVRHHTKKPSLVQVVKLWFPHLTGNATFPSAPFLTGLLSTSIWNVRKPMIIITHFTIFLLWYFYNFGWMILQVETMTTNQNSGLVKA